MTAAPIAQEAVYLGDGQVAEIVALLEQGFGQASDRREAVLFHQGLLDALDRGDHRRCLVWPARHPRAVCHVGAGGRLLPAGDPAAAPAFAAVVGSGAWRVLIGDRPIADAMIRQWGRGWFRRRSSVREQRYMRVLAEGVTDLEPPEGLRLAQNRDLDEITELAARLHVEDLMRPPLSRGGRAAVRVRMAESIHRGETYIVQRGGRVVAKTDVSLRNPDRGAQIAGVYVDPDVRGRGIAAGMVAAVARTLARDGLPGVTLHVRADNASAISAYRRAGFADRGALTLALR